MLPKAARTSTGYRVYSEEAVARVQFVRNALRFGFSLKQIARFVQSRDAGHPPCREVRAAAERILGEMDRQIEELQAARADVRDALVDWNRRLARTPDGEPAHLLETLPPPAHERVTRLPRRRSSRQGQLFESEHAGSRKQDPAYTVGEALSCAARFTS